MRAGTEGGIAQGCHSVAQGRRPYRRSAIFESHNPRWSAARGRGHRRRERHALLPITGGIVVGRDRHPFDWSS
jgi:hypothetical protein